MSNRWLMPEQFVPARLESFFVFIIRSYAQEPIRDGHWLRNLNIHHKMDGLRVAVSRIKRSWDYLSILVDVLHDGKILGNINTWDPPRI